MQVIVLAGHDFVRPYEVQLHFIALLLYYSAAGYLTLGPNPVGTRHLLGFEGFD